jgi:predicted GIY-YIG superfamily endonuclease
MKTYLYRHFDKNDQLLYAGISLSAFQRLAQHRNHAHWFEQISRVEMEQFDTREEALAAERVAIEREKPLFNIQFSEQQAAARSAAKVRRNETIKSKPNPAADNVKRNRQEAEEAFWQWRDTRRKGVAWHEH